MATTITTTGNPLNAFIGAVASAITIHSSTISVLSSDTPGSGLQETATVTLVPSTTVKSSPTTGTLSHIISTIPISTPTSFDDSTSSTSAAKSSATPARSSGLSKPTQVGLGVGISLGALIFMALGGLLTYYVLWQRRGQAVFAHAVLEDPRDDDVIEGTLPSNRSVRELDDLNWKRELPGDVPAEMPS